MRNYHKREQGFTLIELMIVIAIVGILAAIALPAYQDYIVRSKMSEPLAALAEAKTTVAEYVATNGYPTVDVSSFGVNTAYRPDSDILVSLEMSPQFGAPTPGQPIYIGAEVYNSVWEGGVPTTGQVSFFQLSGSTNADGTMSWECINAWGPSRLTAMPVKYLPANCRG